MEAMNGWVKEDLFLDFGLATARNVPKLLDEYVHYYNFQQPVAALVYIRGCRKIPNFGISSSNQKDEIYFGPEKSKSSITFFRV